VAAATTSPTLLRDSGLHVAVTPATGAWLLADLACAVTCETLLRWALKCAATGTNSARACKLPTPGAWLAGERPLAVTAAWLALKRLVTTALTGKTSAVVVDGADAILAEDARSPLVASGAIAVVVAKDKTE